jgi:TDG/mug DNA glycosylase family protein
VGSLVIRMNWLGQRIRTFRDLLPERPRALFVGLNPSPVSLDAGHYHQGRMGRRMWRRLESSGVILPPPPGLYHDEWLFRLGFGLTDLVKRPSPRSRDLTPADFAHGRRRLVALIRKARPPLVCFIYKKAAEVAVARRLPPGADLLADTIGDSGLFLLPGPYSDEAAARPIFAHLEALLASHGWPHTPRSAGLP